MALLRSCRRLFPQIFTNMPTTCQLRFMNQLMINHEHKGYVYTQLHNISYNNTKEHNFLINNISQNCDKSIIEFNEKLQHLRNDFKDMRIEYQDLLKTLKIYAECIKNVQDDDNSIGIFLLYCCGKVLPDVKQKTRQSLTRNVWRLLKKNKPKLFLNDYHALLDVCAQNKMKINPEEFLNNMGIKPDKFTYKLLLNVIAKTGDLEGQIFVLTKIKEQGYSLEHEELCALIELHWISGDIKSANHVVETMISSGVTPQIEIYGSLACGHASNGDIESTIKLLEQHPFNNRQLLRILKYLSLSNEGYIQKIFKYLDVASIINDPLLINTIFELVHYNKITDAVTLVNYCVDYNKNTSHNLVKHLLRALVHAKVSVLTITKITMEYNNLYDAKLILHDLLHDTLVTGYTELAFVVLEEMKRYNFDIRQHYYWPLLIEAAKEQGESAVFQIIDCMLKMDVLLDSCTILDYVIPYISTCDPLNVYKKLIEHRITQTVALTSLLSYFLDNGQLENALLLCNEAKVIIDFDDLITPLVKSYKLTQNVDSCTKILKFASQKKDYPGLFFLHLLNNELFANNDKVLRIFINCFKKYNVSIANYTAELISQKLAKIGGAAEIIDVLAVSETDGKKWPVLERLTGIPHPRDMSQEELECHLIELKSKGLETRGALRKLFMMHCLNNNLKRVEQLKEEMKICGFPLTPGMKARLFALYAHHDRVSDFCSIFQDLQKNHPDFKIDPPKILSAATSLVQHNKIEMALEVVKYTPIVKFKAPRSCWQLLNAIAHSEQSHLTEQTLDILLDSGYCSICNLVLGPLIRQHLVKNDLPAAVKTFERLVNEYKKTPLRQELISILVECLNNDLSKEKYKLMLQNVVSLATGIVGNEQVIMDLIIAYARYDMLDELRTGLQVLLIQACN